MAQTSSPPPKAATTKTAATQTSTTKSTTAKPAAAKTTTTKPAAPAPMTDEQKQIYAVGLTIYRSLGSLDLSPAEIDIVKRALTDAAAGKPAIELNEWGPKIEPLAKSRGARVAERQKIAAKAYLDKAATAPGAVKEPSGLIYKETMAGTGASPKATDTVKVHYRGTLVDGTEFDSSYKRNEPAKFPLNGVIPCWTEGVQKMKVGGKATLVCPSSIAYGENGHPPVIPGGATLVFEIELLEIGGGK
ncbi:MAG: FKBP-type peptidyl-prolyl cis-trans isomerase [Bryobacteraceae bacterium]